MTFFASGIRKTSTPSGVRTPTGIDDIFAWFDANEGTYKTGATVTRWQSKVNRHFVTASANEGPQLVTNAINGNSSLDFLNNVDIMANDAPAPNNGLTAIASGSTNFSIFIVASSIDNGGSDTLIRWGEKGNSSDGTYILLHPTTGLNTQVNNSTGARSLTTNTFERDDDEFHIYSSVFGATTDEWVTKIDGVIRASSVSAVDELQDANIDIFKVGRRVQTGADPWWGGIAEIIIYDRALSTQDVVKVEGYLFDKYYNPENFSNTFEWFKADEGIQLA